MFTNTGNQVKRGRKTTLQVDDLGYGDR